MNIIQSLFNKELYKIELEVLKTFFADEQEETSTLEFKSGKVSLDTIYKEVCAFLNTEGGVLIIGTPREQNIELLKREVKVVCKGELVPNTEIRNKDWLVQKIASNITPSPTGIGVQEIEADKGKCFIIHIEQSLYPPHQCSDSGVYYIRLEREAKPAPHGLVQALFFKRQLPKLKIIIECIEGNEDNNFKQIVYIQIKNISSTPTEKISSIVEFYNVKDVYYSADFANNHKSKIISKNKIYNHQTHQDVILAKGIGIVLTYEFDHFNNPYIIRVQSWGKSADPIESTIIYDPSKKEIVELYSSGFENRKPITYFFKKTVEYKKKQKPIIENNFTDN